MSRAAGHTCLVAQVIEDMAAREALSLSAGARSPRQPLSQSRWLELHLGIFAIAGWNMAAIDFAYGPQHLWFWPWLTAWAALVTVHAGIVLLRPRHTARRRQTRPQARDTQS